MKLVIFDRIGPYFSIFYYLLSLSEIGQFEDSPLAEATALAWLETIDKFKPILLANGLGGAGRASDFLRKEYSSEESDGEDELPESDGDEELELEDFYDDNLSAPDVIACLRKLTWLICSSYNGGIDIGYW